MPELGGVLKLEVSFEICAIKLIFFSGADFDFKIGAPVKVTPQRNSLY
jgi:hypothetical protein